MSEELDVGIQTMDALYEESFGPTLDAQEEAAESLREKLKAIPGLTLEGSTNDIICFNLEWHFRERKMERRLSANIVLYTNEYPNAPLVGDGEAQEFLRKDQSASVLGKFFLQFGWRLNVRRWPECKKCGVTDFTIDIVKFDFHVHEYMHYDAIAYIPLIKKSHACPKHNEK